MDGMSEYIRVFAFLNLLFCLPSCATSRQPQGNYEKPAGPSGPLLGILVDGSFHQRNVAEFERMAVNFVLDRLGAEAEEGFVLKYGGRIELLQDWFPLGRERARLPQIAVDTENDESGRTRLYDAIAAGIKRLETRNDSGSKVLVIIGEGNDFGSSLKYDEVKRLAQSAHVQCFALLVADHNLMEGRVRHFGFYLYNLARTTKGAGYDIEASRKHLEKAVVSALERIQLFHSNPSIPDPRL